MISHTSSGSHKLGIRHGVLGGAENVTVRHSLRHVRSFNVSQQSFRK